ncbi:tryptophan synthase subunit alpha [Candidatus Zinderia endosymbiont of Aphrophora alni]|uniref:tryptophan synthase subunit alpha n=1 Tax=Candidatus Zinderia endosymbiont of Aphrophora alni TaxID=3077951 RepID=UPI0030D54040
MSRIKETFSKLALLKKKALITFITANDPAPKYTLKLMNTLVKYGANIIEIGIPFSDPMAEGKTIQKSHKRSLKFKTNLKNILKNIYNFRKFNKITPIILMGYANSIEKLGINNFIYQAKISDIDGIIIVDYPPEECKKFTKKMKNKKIDQIFLISPTTNKKRIEKISKINSGFIYYVSLKGVTGSKNIEINNLQKKINIIKNYTKLPINIGFGINSLKIIEKIKNIADGIIIGSKIIKKIKKSSKENIFNDIKKLIKNIRYTLDK